MAKPVSAAMKLHEGLACDAVLRRIEEREGATRSALRWPEKDHSGAPVELVCNVGAQSYAFEHTAIEPFKGLIKLNNQADEHFKPIEAAVNSFVPADEVYDLMIPVNAFEGLKLKEIQKLQVILSEWIKQTAPILPKRLYADLKGITQTTPPGVPFPVYLCRFQGVVAGYNRLQIHHLASGDREAPRKERLRQASDDKFGKLALWKANGARTVLVLENPDIQLTNVAHVAETLISITQTRTDTPDEIYQVDTYATGFWYLWPLLISDKTYFDLGRKVHPLGWEIDPATLTSVTSR